MAHDTHELKAPTDIQIVPGTVPARLPLIGGVLAVVGLAITLFMAMGEQRERAMFSYLWAYEVCLTLALGGLIWVMIEHAVRSGWSTALRRVGETTAATIPLFAVLFIPIATFGYHSLYPWTHETDPVLAQKVWYLSDGFFFGRAIFYFASWIVSALLLYRWSTRQDVTETLEGRAVLTRRMWRLSAPGILIFALTSSFAAIDWIMSLQPHWYSTIFGIYLFARSILGFYAFLTLVTMGLRRSGVLREAVTTEHFHDLGKYTFGFTIFWAYIAFSQFLLIWYANIPEETEFFLARLHGGWQYLSYAMPVMHFALPFLFLLSRNIKRRNGLLAIAATWTLLMHLVDLYWLIMPNFGIHGEGHAEPALAVSWMDFVALFGMAGAFLAVFGFLLGRNRVIAVQDPRLFESLAHENY